MRFPLVAQNQYAPTHSPSMSVSSLSSTSSFNLLEVEEEPFTPSTYSATMDPTYVISGPGAVLQCLTVCSQSLAQLQHLQREYNNSPPATLEALTIEVRQVARALSGVNGLFYDPDKDVASTLESNMDLQQLFDNVLRPTQIIFTSLEQEMRGLFLPAYDHEPKEDDTKARARYLFTDNVLKNFLSLVRTTRSVLTMLTTAMQMKTPMEVNTMLTMSEPIIADINERAIALSGSLSPLKDTRSVMTPPSDDYFISAFNKEMLPSRTNTMTSLNHAAMPASQIQFMMNNPYYSMDSKPPPLSPPPMIAVPSPPPPVPPMPTGQFANLNYQNEVKSPVMTNLAFASPSPPPSVPSPPLPERSRLRSSTETSNHGDRQGQLLQRSPSSASRPASRQQQIPTMQQGAVQNRPRTASQSRVATMTKGLPPTPLPSIPLPPTPPPGIHPAFRGTNKASPIEPTVMSASWASQVPQHLPIRQHTPGLPDVPIAPLTIRRQPSSRHTSPPGSGANTPQSLAAVPAVSSNLQSLEARIPEASAAAERTIEVTTTIASNNMVLTPKLGQVPMASPVINYGASARASVAAQSSHNSVFSQPSASSSRTSIRLFPSMRRTPSRLAKEEAMAAAAPEVFVPPHPTIPYHYATSPTSTLMTTPSSATTSSLNAISEFGQQSSLNTPRYSESVYSDDTAAAASSQALPASDNNSINFNPEAGQHSRSSSSVRSKQLNVVDFNVLIPRVRTTSATLPPRPDEVEDQLRREKDAVLATSENNEHLRWAEDVLRQHQLMTRFKRRLARVGYQQVLPTLTADGLTLDARNIVERFARDGIPRALFLKARWFELEDSVVQELYLSALSKGYLRAAFYLGKKYEAKKDFSTAFEYYRKGAYGQDSACGYRLAKIYLKGELGKKKDHKAAVPLLQGAAANADRDAPFAPYLLGMLHTKAYQKSISMNKKYISQDPFAARAQISHAATLGLSQALTNLGKAYGRADNELSLPEDHLTSLHYLYLGSIGGDGEADLALSNAFWWGQQGFWGPNEKIAFMYAKMSANENHIAAFCQVGYFHERGIGANIDLSEARAYYIKGSSGGDKMAMNRLDGLRRGGKITLGIQKGS